MAGSSLGAKPKEKGYLCSSVVCSEGHGHRAGDDKGVRRTILKFRSFVAAPASGTWSAACHLKWRLMYARARRPSGVAGGGRKTNNKFSRFLSIFIFPSLSHISLLVVQLCKRLCAHRPGHCSPCCPPQSSVPGHLTTASRRLVFVQQRQVPGSPDPV